MRAMCSGMGRRKQVGAARRGSVEDNGPVQQPDDQRRSTPTDPDDRQIPTMQHKGKLGTTGRRGSKFQTQSEW